MTRCKQLLHNQELAPHIIHISSSQRGHRKIHMGPCRWRHWAPSKRRKPTAQWAESHPRRTDFLTARLPAENSEIENVKLSLRKPRTPQFVTQMDTICKRWTLTSGSLMVTSDFFLTRPFLQNERTGNSKSDCHRCNNTGKVQIQYHNKNLKSSSVLTILVMSNATI